MPSIRSLFLALVSLGAIATACSGDEAPPRSLELEPGTGGSAGMLASDGGATGNSAPRDDEGLGEAGTPSDGIDGGSGGVAQSGNAGSANGVGGSDELGFDDPFEAGGTFNVGAGGAGGSEPEPPGVLVDRFSHAAGTLFVRDAMPSLPGPGEPIDFDESPFLLSALGPNGEQVLCYDLDVRVNYPSALYVAWDAETASFVAEQLPIFDVLPGEPGYSDFWRIVRMHVPPDYVANSVRSVDEIIDNELVLEPTPTIVNRALVPRGSTALLAGTDGAEPARRGWYRGEPVYYLAFEEHPLEVTGYYDQVPLATLWAAFVTNPEPEDPALGLQSGFLTEAEAGTSRSVFSALPGDEAYSPLLSVQAYDNAVFEGVVDNVTAAAAPIVAADVAMLNCPIVEVDGERQGQGQGGAGDEQGEGGSAGMGEGGGGGGGGDGG